MLAQGSYHFTERRSDAKRGAEALSQILDALRRIWTVLKERLAPNRPVPVPIRVARGR
jgi:hypothetical protein